LKFVYDVDKVTTNIDKSQVKQILLNLVSNSIKFTEKGDIKLKVHNMKDHFLFTISDTGIGIKKEDFSKVFDKFEQINHGLKTEKGTGLGLVITKQMVENHGGKIWFDSKHGKGSTFYFTIPISI